MKLLFTLMLTLFMSTDQDPKLQFLGDWEGTLNVEAANVQYPLVLKVREKEGKLVSTLDSPDQGGYDMPFDKSEFADGTLTLTMTQNNAVFSGKLEDKKVVGKWSQNGMTFDLTFTKIVRKGKS